MTVDITHHFLHQLNKDFYIVTTGWKDDAFLAQIESKTFNQGEEYLTKQPNTKVYI